MTPGLELETALLRRIDFFPLSLTRGLELGSLPVTGCRVKVGALRVRA